jgi:hypothetical protein
MGFGGGTLTCTAGCTFDTAGCHDCGNGLVDAGEECDGAVPPGEDCTTVPGGFTAGTLSCGTDCLLNADECFEFPDGDYAVSPVPTHYCAFGAVNFSIGTFSFDDTGFFLNVTGAPCVMSGASAEVSRVIDVTCTIPGGCDETYSLTGTFTDDYTWTGTFTAAFTGGGCWDCFTQVWSVTGHRT